MFRKILATLLLLMFLGGAYAGFCDIDWKWERTITLTDVNAQDVIRIDINSDTMSPFNNFFDASVNDGNSVCFVADGTDTKLYHEKLYWNADANAGFDVNVGTSNSAIRIRYGDDVNNLDTSQPDKVYNVYDDFEDGNFEDGNPWTWSTIGSWSIVNGILAWDSGSDFDWVYTDLSAQKDYSGGLLLEARVADYWQRIAINDTSNYAAATADGYELLMDSSSNIFKIVKRVGGVNTDCGTQSSGIVTGYPITISLIRDSSGKFTAHRNYEVDEIQSCVNTNATSGRYPIMIHGNGAARTDEYDWIKFSYQFDNDNTQSFGSENPHTGVSASFIYTINKALARVDFNDSSVSQTGTMSDWNWLVNGKIQNTDQNFSWDTNQLQDLNVCLQAGDNIGGSDQACTHFSTGDWEAPSTTLTSTNNTNESSQTLNFTCTDNNSGCNTLIYSIDGGADNNVDISSGNFSVAVFGAGIHDINYYSQDYEGNDENVNSDSYTTYGHVTFEVVDEDAENRMSGVTVTIDGNSVDTDANGRVTFDMSTFSTTSSSYGITVTETGYTTKTITYDLNRFAVIDVNVLLLADGNGLSITFQLYEPNQSTLLSNATVLLRNHDLNWYVAGRGKTNSNGEITFYVDPNDENYSFHIVASDADTFDYNSMTLTVNVPRDEETGTAITNPWQLEVTGLAWQDYNNLSANQPVQIYSDTKDRYKIIVADVNSEYFERKYFVNFVGGTTAGTLQPYLSKQAGAVSTTIRVISGYTEEPVPDVEVRIYKLIPGFGRVLVEQVVSDGKGEAFVSLRENDDYEFEVYVNSVLQFSQDITATSTTIFIRVDNKTITIPPAGVEIGEGDVTVLFTPSRSKLIKADDSLVQVVRWSGPSVNSIQVYITNTDVNGVAGNDVNIYDVTFSSGLASPWTNTLTLNYQALTINGNTYDNNGYLIVNVVILTDTNTVFRSFVYSPVRGFDWFGVLSQNIKPTFGCSSDPTTPCPVTILTAVFISLIISIGLAITTGFADLRGIGAIVLIILGFFAAISWVPILVYGLVFVVTLLLMLAAGGKKI